MKINKAFLVSVVLLVAGGATIFAAGQGERPENVEQGRRFTADTTEVTVTGTVEYRGEYPVLIVGDDAYSLSAWGGGLYADDLQEGMELTVTGEQIEALDSSRSDADYHIFVASAQADGEAIELDAPGSKNGAQAGDTASRNGGGATARRSGGNVDQDRGSGRQASRSRGNGNRS